MQCYVGGRDGKASLSCRLKYQIFQRDYPAALLDARRKAGEFLSKRPCRARNCHFYINQSIQQEAA
jgi:hypothetical protein